MSKVNLDLRVLGKRPDGYHELRTIFQTISLADTLDIAFTPGGRTDIELLDKLAIADNLIVRAARAVMDQARTRGQVEITLRKKIPMGGGLGGGSSDAAAVLLALPVLAGARIPFPKIHHMAQELGSDVPFFLLGGTAAGIGRGGELFPLPDGPVRRGILVTPGVSVSTADAYRALSPRLTLQLQENKIFSFQSQAWDLGGQGSAANDFEEVVFEQHRSLATLKRRLVRAGAAPALMTGSGSALFGFFRSEDEVSRALGSFRNERAFRILSVSRARYRTLWWRALEEHIDGRVWPPRSRY